jgi:predicted transcriptional regulator
VVDEKKGSGITIEKLMTTEVETLSPTTTVGQAIELFLSKKISGTPIVDQAERVISVVSEADLMKFAAIAGLKKPLQDFLGKLTPADKLVTVAKSDSFVQVFKQFMTKPVRRVLVTDSNGRLQGLVSRRNLLEIFLKIKKEEEQESNDPPKPPEPK